MHPIKVLMVINQFHPIVGGAERQAQKLAQGLLEKGVHVEVLTARRRGLKKREVVDGVPVRRHRVFHVPFGRRKLFYTLSYVTYVFFYLVRHRKSFDVVHVHQALYPAFVCSLAARLLGSRSIVKSASSGELFDLFLLQQKPLIGRLMVRTICRYTDCFVAISTHIRHDLIRFGVAPDRIEIIPNGVEIPEESHRPEQRSGRARFVAGFVGTLLPLKNVETILRAWAALPAHLRDDCRLLIVGDGPERNRLEAYVRSLGIADHTVFCGRQADVSRWLKQMDAYVSTSVVEGLSNSLLEAMAHRKTCIVSEGVSGNVDLIQDGENGFLVDPTDHRRLAELLALLAENADRRRELGAKARETVAQRCAMSIVVQKYLDLYRGIQSSRRTETRASIPSGPTTTSSEGRPPRHGLAITHTCTAADTSGSSTSKSCSTCGP